MIKRLEVFIPYGGGASITYIPGEDNVKSISFWRERTAVYVDFEDGTSKFFSNMPFTVIEKADEIPF